MMMRALGFIVLLISPAVAQDLDNSRVEELRETLRFIRLAETKKKLPFNEDKLLRLNAMLDDYEAKRFELNRQERKLRQRIKLMESTEDAQAELVLDEYIALKKSEAENNIKLWEDLKQFLSPAERLQFLRFYEEFQREVQRRARMMQNRRNGPRRPFRQ